MSTVENDEGRTTFFPELKLLILPLENMVFPLFSVPIMKMTDPHYIG
jgi:hypothetical protein